MKKGVILEIKEHYVTLMTSDGEFMRTRRLQQDYQIGEELFFFPMEIEAGKTEKIVTSLKGMKGRLILFSLVLFLAVVLFPVFESRQAYAYMSIDVNPSIELGLNEKLLVISMEAFNQEGEEIIEKMTDWKHKRVVVVATQILNEVEGMGYFNQEREVLISTVNSENQSVVPELEETVQQIQKVTDEEELVVTVLKATPKERENAVKQGISAGVYKQKQEPNKNYTSNKEELEKGKINNPGTLGKESFPEAHPATNGLNNGKAHKNEERAEKNGEKLNNNGNKNNNSAKKENSKNQNNSKDRQYNNNQKHNHNNGNQNNRNQNNNHNNGNQNNKNQNNNQKNQGNQNKGNQKNGKQHNEGKHQGNGRNLN